MVLLNSRCQHLGVYEGISLSTHDGSSGVPLGRWDKMQRALLAMIVSCGLGCGPSSPVATQLDADPAVLRGALSDWQEGPTDGRICLALRVLPASDATGAFQERWSNAVIEALLMDTLISVDTTAAPRTSARQRVCTPTDKQPRIVLGRPHIRGDSADAETAAWEPVAGSDSGAFRRYLVVLARQGERWEIARRIGPSAPFIELPLHP